MDRIYFTVNGNKCSVGSERDADTFLNDYIRDVLNLRGTKYMCKEGGCGACVVAVTATEQGQTRTFSVNSCLVSAYSAQDWEITTIEGIGNRGKGYHPVQKTLAEYNGTQCGYCSPGWVMSMYRSDSEYEISHSAPIVEKALAPKKTATKRKSSSKTPSDSKSRASTYSKGDCAVADLLEEPKPSLLEANHYDLTKYEIENSFGSNTCRCTGFRPILDAFKSFAKDAPKPVTKHVHDIEDLSNLNRNCANKESCKKKCASWCFVSHSDTEPKKIKKIPLKDGSIWYRVNEVQDIFEVFEKEGVDSYMLVNGNTGRGASPILKFPKVLIDIRPIDDLKRHIFDQNLIIGAGITLTDLMTLFKVISKEKEDFAYLQKLYDHLDLVAHIPVRNVGTVAGNLMVKHRQPTFSSDIFLLLESVGAYLVIAEKDKTIEVTPEEFLDIDMTGRVIVQFKMPPLSKNCEFVSFKIMPRAQNAHAQVNAAFLYKFDEHELDLVLSARIVIGGLSAHFVHARKTEKYLAKKKIFNNVVLQEALKILDAELVVDDIAGEMKPKYRRKCALGLFYKGLLVLIPDSHLKPRYHSGARDFRKTRPLSKGSEVYDTNPVIWPVNEPMPKLDALVQCAGEVKYVNDLPTEANEVFCAFVTADIAKGEVVDIDPSAALKIPGVLAFFSAKDIPGDNNFISLKSPLITFPEEIFASKNISFYDQAIGLIVAETDVLAHRASLLVEVKYKKDETKPLLTINEVRDKDPRRVSLFFVRPATDRGFNVKTVVSGCDNILAQYHFTMETLSTVTRPSEVGMDVFAATQWPDSLHLSLSDELKIQQNRINLMSPRCGGAYGVKITRTNHVACASALVTHLMHRPCRFVLSIQASLRMIGKRLPSTREFEAGVSDSGEIQYMEYHLYEDNGYVVTDPVSPLTIAGVKNCYDSRRWSFKVYDVTTDTPSNTYFRSPGSLEAISMTEQVMEQISYEIDRDPVQVRLANLGPEMEDVADVVRTLLRDGEYDKRKKELEMFNKQNRWKKRGLRIAIMSWPVPVLIGYTVLLSVYHGDGSIIITHGGIEMGQGINTKVAQAVAYTLNISLDKVRCRPTDAGSSPNNFVSGGSRTTQAVCYGAIKCCQIILDRLSAVREILKDPTWEVLIESAFTRGINLQASYSLNGNDQEVYRSAGACLAEVELDILTGEHEILRVDIVEDVGTSINPELDIGQIEGAFMMGVGYWTHEELIIDEKTGELLTDRTWYYHVPLAKDIPIDFRIQLRRNSYNPIGTLGAKAVAEPPTCLAIAVAFALREAIVSSREETGYPRNKWFNVDGPFTIQANVLKADVHLEEFLFN